LERSIGPDVADSPDPFAPIDVSRRSRHSSWNDVCEPRLHYLHSNRGGGCSACAQVELAVAETICRDNTKAARKAAFL
jgi:hypothetical protein